MATQTGRQEIDRAMPVRDSFRAWTVVIAAFIGLLISLGTLVIYSFGVLSSAMAAEFGWGALERGTLFASLSLAATVGGPLWGAFADRWGGRRAALTSSLLLALGLFALSFVPSNAVAMYAAFAVVGFLGSGTMPPTFASVVVGWFEKHRGLALGVSMMSVGIAAAALPPIAAALTSKVGWRMTFVVYGVAILAIVIPTTLLLLRPHPGAQAEVVVQTSPRGRLIRAAFSERKTWILALFAFVTGAVLASSVSNFVPMLQGRGESLASAAGYQSVLGISLIAGRVLLGGLIDRVFAPYVMLGVLVVTCLGFFTLYALDSPFAYVVAALGIGLAIGAEVDFLGFMVSRYFESASFATLFAILFATYALGATLGTPFFGWLAESSAGYSTGQLLGGVLIACLAISMLLLPSYADEQSAEAGAGHAH